ncbi:MAG: hypothetical protein H0V01_02825 [Bacteroidetes bacterium]|nr:hypothetical protein [Bacteroidota bacterium]HET6244745.1 hypothetical protein [Bacteroidia bacterium]
MKKILFKYPLLILLVLPCFLKAQETKSIFNAGLGIGYLGVRDKGMSPFLYSGKGYFSSFTYQTFTEEKINSIDLNLGYGKIKHKKTEAGILHNGIVEISYKHLRGIIKKEKYTVFLGGGLGFFSAYRYQPFFLNSAHNYDIIHWAGVVALMNYEIPAHEKTFVLSGSLVIPAFSGVIRPAYASPLPDGLQTFPAEVSDAYLKSIKFMSFNRFIRINSRFSVDYPVFKQHLLGLAYEWDFYSLKTENPVLFAGHKIMLSMLIKLR